MTTRPAPPRMKVSRRRTLRILATATALGGMAALPLLRRGNGAEAQLAQEWRGAALGAEARILLLHPRPEMARAAIEAVVVEIDRLEAQFSLYRPGSALSQLNRDGRLDRPSLDMRCLLAEAVRFGELTGGIFDVTIQPLWEVLARHFGGAAVAAEPLPAALDAAHALVDYRALDIGPGQVRFARPGMAVTLNGIAQGYITDRVTEMLCEAGLPEVLVDIGELRAPGTASGGRPWHIRLDHPSQPGGMFDIDLAGAAVATSAGRASPFTTDARWHHILDPRTGGCPPADRASSVIAPTAAAADALATALTLAPELVEAGLLRSAGAVRAVVTAPRQILDRWA